MSSNAPDFTSYPLSTSLTRRVVNFLSFYRLIIAVVLGFGYFSGLVSTDVSDDFPEFASVTLIGFVVLACLHVLAIYRKRFDYYRLARYSMATDAICLTLLLFAFGGLDNGVGILLVFTSALAAMLLPLRYALFLASLASLAMIGQASWQFLNAAASLSEVIKAALYSITAMVSALMSHRLAYWARDYRLIAEKQRVTLTELEHVNELIIRRMRTGVIALDHNRKIKVINEAAWLLLGSPTLRQRSLEEVSPRLKKALADWEREAYLEPKPVMLEPSQAQVLPNFIPLPSEFGTGTVIILNDSNVVARSAAELSANSLAKLSSSIAHEIRNPLAAVTHAAQLLEESSVVRLPEMRLINIIQNQSARMNGIVENILQLSRREQSRPELVNLNEFLNEIVGEVATSHSTEPIDFQHEIGPTETLVVFDRSQLNQAIWKLLDNAIAHATRGERRPTVVLQLNRDLKTNSAVVAVKDNGPGIAPAQMGKIFEPFYTTRQEGSGLGLYIARQLCEANQAELSVRSAPGEGASFQIKLAMVRKQPIPEKDDAGVQKTESMS